LIIKNKANKAISTLKNKAKRAISPPKIRLIYNEKGKIH